MKHIVALNIYGENEILEKISFSRISPSVAREYCEKINNTKLNNEKWVYSKIIVENNITNIEGIRDSLSDDFDNESFTFIDDSDCIIVNIFGEDDNIVSISFVVLGNEYVSIDYCKTLNKIGLNNKKWNYAKILHYNEDLYVKKPVPKYFNELKNMEIHVLEEILNVMDPFKEPLLHAISDDKNIVEKLQETDRAHNFGFNFLPEAIDEIKTSLDSNKINLAKEKIMQYIMTLGFSN